MSTSCFSKGDIGGGDLFPCDSGSFGPGYRQEERSKWSPNQNSICTNALQRNGWNILDPGHSPQKCPLPHEDSDEWPSASTASDELLKRSSPTARFLAPSAGRQSTLPRHLKPKPLPPPHPTLTAQCSGQQSQGASLCCASHFSQTHVTCHTQQPRHGDGSHKKISPRFLAVGRKQTNTSGIGHRPLP